MTSFENFIRAFRRAFLQTVPGAFLRIASGASEDQAKQLFTARVQLLLVKPSFPHRLHDLIIMGRISRHGQGAAAPHGRRPVMDRRPVADDSPVKAPFIP